MELRGAPVTAFYTADVARRAAERRRLGLPVIAMHFGQPSEGPPQAALAAAAHALTRRDLGYWESPELRARLVRHYEATYGIELEPQQVLLTGGASAGLVALFATVFAPGDRVAIVCPGYPAYRNALVSLGLVPVELRTAAAEGYRLTSHMLARLDPAPHGLLLASPANPTGTVTPGAELGAIAGICRERGIRLLSDEIYHGLSYGLRTACALEFEREAFVVGSFSKLHRMPGWRLGWLISPAEHAATLRDAAINLFLTPAVLSQHAALAAMDAGPELERSVARYALNRRRLVDGLQALGVGAADPDGAFYVYADFSRYTADCLRFCQRAIDEIGVGMAPGVDFDRLGGASHVRVCFAVLEDELETALRLLGQWLPGYRD